MSDIEKVNILESLKRYFKVDDSIIKTLESQIEDHNVKNNLNRFQRGFKIEEDVALVYSVLPFVKLFHGLKQNTYQNFLKKNFQIPDYLMFYETCKIQTKPLLVEVKSVKEDSIEMKNLMSKQVDNLINYSNTMNTPLVFLIYWEKFNATTLNAIDIFEHKNNKYNLHMFKGIQSDLSLIVGDVTIKIPKIFRKTYFDTSKRNGEWTSNIGDIIKEQISFDNKNFTNIDFLESSILNSFLSSKTIHQETNGTIITLTIESETSRPRLSYLIQKFIKYFKSEPSENYCLFASNQIVSFFKKMNFEKLHILPKIRTKVNDLIMKEAFEESIYLTAYLEGYKE